MTSRRNYIYIFLLLLLTVCSIYFLLSKKHLYNTFVKINNDKLSEVYSLVTSYYVDTVDKTNLTEHAIRGMLLTLDPHSQYFTPKENKEANENLDGNFSGIGVQFMIIDDTVTVKYVIPDGPSDKAGIKFGDKIVIVDTQLFVGDSIDNDFVLLKLRGKKNSLVTLGVKREENKDLIYFTVKRGTIFTNTIEIAQMLDAETGYIKIEQFGITTADEFSNALLNLKKEGMKKLILDLRNNPGGYLEGAIKVCDELLPANRLITYTEGLHSRLKKYKSSSNGTFEEGALVVLIDDFSASASEIVAGAVQDNDRGLIIGRRSFGKGLVQRQFTLNDNSSVRITVARYHTPSGRVIQKPYSKGIEDYEMDIVRRYYDGEMDSISNNVFLDTIPYLTLNKRTVYGGGGIMPDIFVPIDRDNTFNTISEIVGNSAFYSFTLRYTANNLDKLKKKYPTAKSFVANMIITEPIYQDFIKYYSKRNNKNIINLNSEIKKQIKLRLKASIGQNLFQMQGYFPVIYKTDKVITTAIEALKDNKPIK